MTVASLAVLALALARSSSTPAAAVISEPVPRTPQTSKDGVLGRIDLAVQRRPWTAIPVAAIRRFGDDRAGRLAALIAYYGFFSIFPAMLALVTILGFALEGDEQLRRDIANSALGQFPIIGDTIASSVASPLGGNPIALVVGLAGALWAGLGAMQAAQDAMNGVWRVQHEAEPTFVAKRLRSLLMLVVISALLISSTTLAQLATLVVPGVAATAVLFVLTVGWNVLAFMVAFRVLTVKAVSWRDVGPGACVAGGAYTLLQLFGGVYVSRVLDGASQTYGTFAVVIGLLSWLFLIAQITMLSAEINVVITERGWPRSLFAARAG